MMASRACTGMLKLETTDDSETITPHFPLRTGHDKWRIIVAG